MKKSFFVLALGLVAIAAGLYAAGFASVRNGAGANPANSGKMAVVGTFYPLAHFALQVGGNLVTVANITPAGAEPHDYEPTPQDIAGAYRAKVFIMNGGGVDTWAERIAPDLKAKGVQVVDMQDTILLSTAPSGSETTLDPHIWLDPVLSEQEVALIRDAFVKADPVNAVVYANNAASYIAQLQALDEAYKAGLASCRIKDIVTSHAAFGYMAKRYGLTQIAIAGLSPDAEPSAEQMANIANLAKKNNVKYIFFESLVSPKLAQTIATEVGAQTIAFNPLEGLTDEQISSGETYLTVMRDNLDELRIALQCN
jgi:zinc transport system substrate-binding protein